MSTTAVGLLAGLLTTGAWLPQIYRSWTTRSCSGLSWIYLATMVAGFATWLAFGLLAGEVAVVITNAISLFLAVTLAVVKASSGIDQDSRPALSSGSLKRFNSAPVGAGPRHRGVP